MAEARVLLDEIFVSLQGEAGEAGRAQLFLRLAGCPLRCAYCDSPRSWEAHPEFRLWRGEAADLRSNPVHAVELEGVLAEAAAAHGVAAHTLPLAVTGGEPLVQAAFLEAWLPTWPAPVLLETAGILPDRLVRLLPHLDVVSLDWKLDSTVSCGRGLLAPAACAAALRASGTAGWIKLVVTEGTSEEELAAALCTLSRTAPGLQVFLQPATPFADGPGPPPPARLLAWALRFQDLDLDLRVLPQIHGILGLR